MLPLAMVLALWGGGGDVRHLSPAHGCGGGDHDGGYADDRRDHRAQITVPATLVRMSDPNMGGRPDLRRDRCPLVQRDQRA